MNTSDNVIQSGNVLPTRYIWVDKYLCRGPHPSIFQLIKLKKAGVTQIYDFRHESIRYFKFIERWGCELLGIKYMARPYSNLYGEYPDVAAFETIAKSVVQNGENGGVTLFHCNSGRHRTAHFSAFYKLTRGQPLNVIKKQLGDDYRATVWDIAKEQIIDAGYFSRHTVKNNTLNPVSAARIKFNNACAVGLYNAMAIFIRQMGA